VTQVIVVGAGHNGLVAAIHLAARGLDVTVLEHGPHPGGAARSVSTTLPGFLHDHCAAFVPMAAVSPAIAELELDVAWIDPGVVMAHPFPDGSAIALHREVGRTAASLGGRAGEGWAAAMRRLVPHSATLAEAVLRPLPPMRQAARLALALRRDGLEWARRLAGSVEALGLDVFEGDRRATAWLAGSAQHSGLPPTAAPSGAFGLLLQLVAHSHGWPLVGGGMGRVSDALAARARAEGATIRCDASVERILVRGGRVAGVRLRGGEELAAGAVVSTVTATLLARLLPDGALPGRLHRRLRIWRSGTAPFKVDYALSGPLPWTAEEPREAAVVHVGGELDGFVRAADAATRGVLPEQPALVVGQQSLLDPARAPAGQHTLYVYAHVPARYEEPDEVVAERIEAQLERFAPGWSSRVLARALRSPRETERENPSLVDGDLAGGSYELDQQLIFRPAPELCRYRTPLRGLYMAGASVHPGGAVHGMSGRGAARALLRDRRLHRV
jgi:phytoene dehydrogenase-like protein